MPEPQKSDVMKNVLRTLISISGRRIDPDFAISTMDAVIKQLEPRFLFLKHVQIKDTLYTENTDMISVMSDINSVNVDEMGKALSAIITTLNQSLGERAGHFFLKELQHTLGDEYVSVMKDMGVDLSLLRLEDEVTRMRRMLSQTKE